MIVRRENPTAQEYLSLRSQAGMTFRSTEASKQALSRSLFSVCLRDEKNKLIGMGRVVGDQGSHVQVVDIAVHPDHQKKGLSHLIMKEIMSFIENEVDECAFVNLFADVDFLYQKYGFVIPTTSKGMVWKKTNVVVG